MPPYLPYLIATACIAVAAPFLWKYARVLNEEPVLPQQPVAAGEDHIPRPQDIDTNPLRLKHTFKATGGETAALAAVKFCQRFKRWVAFTEEDVARESLMCIHPGLMWLVREGLIVPEWTPSVYRVTVKLVEQLHELYPAKKATA